MWVQIMPAPCPRQEAGICYTIDKIASLIQLNNLPVLPDLHELNEQSIDPVVTNAN
jgi:hypothetical protein